ncbi:putative RNA methyltransferase [Paenibacillus hamazuiensis]|uniref:putative RNA methyltransferase n=1 Tax=Paenibacillus hamazuiensis TaxID=2936508 RepID=UPI00200BE37D
MFDFFAENADLFRCPICCGLMKVHERKSLRCARGHCFDISKHGYVNLLPRPVKTKYDKTMFDSRKIISQAGFFQPLDALITEQIVRYLGRGRDNINILDAGCGEGSHLAFLQDAIRRETGASVLGMGIDISKEAVSLAARQYPGSLWSVADLAKCPLQDRRFPCIVNILSPSNYSEFLRMLARGGIVVKVVPESGYLKELRELFYEPDKQTYSSSGTQERFAHFFKMIEARRLNYTFRLERSLIPHLFRMTPLSWGAGENAFRKAPDVDDMEVTVDLTVLIGTMPG